MGGAALGSSLLTGTTSARRAAHKKRKIRIRRSYDNPTTLAAIEPQKQKLINKSDIHEDIPFTPRGEPVENKSEIEIVAYNADIVDGAISEWVGVRPPKKMFDNTGNDNIQTVMDDIYSVAKEHAHMNSIRREK